MPQVPALTPTEFRRRWPVGEARAAVLLDVREPAELAQASIPEAVHMPMREVPERLHELDADRPLIVMCHSGARSRRVAEYLLTSGFEEVYNLAGGIDAWSQEIDARVPRY
jgi:rhodanese-related sulfurtransferase